MKKLTLLILFLGLTQSLRAALEIQQITISSLNSNDINVHTIIADGYYFEYYNHNYEIVNNTITLNICYSPYLSSVGTFKENDFVVSNINADITNYTLIVNVNYRRWDGTTYNCNSLVGSDSESLVFATPLNATVSLKNEDFKGFEQSLIIYPNPTSGIIKLKGNFTSILKTIKIFDNVGRLVKSVSQFDDNSISLQLLEDGIYTVECASDKEKFSKKIVLKK